MIRILIDGGDSLVEPRLPQVRSSVQAALPLSSKLAPSHSVKTELLPEVDNDHIRFPIWHGCCCERDTDVVASAFTLRD